MTRGNSISHSCRAASASTVVIIFAWHTFTFLRITVGRAWCFFTLAFFSYGCLCFRCNRFWHIFNRHLLLVLVRKSVATWFYWFFTIFMFRLVSLAIYRFRSGFSFFSLLFPSFSLFCCLFLSSDSMVFLSFFIGDFKSIISGVWYSGF